MLMTRTIAVALLVVALVTRANGETTMPIDD
jgi:hypothetical protein